MNGITRYVLSQLTVGMILVTAGLTCVIWLTQSLRFVEMIVNRGLTADTFLYLTILLLPNFLTLILPIALFAVVVFTYSKMIGDRELVVMRAAGLSQAALARPALILALAVAGLGYALNLYFIPASYKAFRELQWDIRYSYSHILLQEGAFNSVSDDITVYVRERSRDGELLGVLVHDARDPEKPATLMAGRGAMVEHEDGARVIMFDGNRQEVDRATDRMSILYFDRYTFNLDTARKKVPDRFREARERTIDELFDPDSDPHMTPKDRGKFIVEGHQRLTSPFQGLAFTLIGLACLISGAFTRRTQARRVVAAVVLVVALQGLTMGLGNAAARNLGLVPLLYVNAILPMVLAWYFMVRQPRRRRRRRRPDDDAVPA